MKAKKSLGQNFLKDDTIKNNIVSLFCANENDIIIEIGPGRGALTKLLSKQKAKLICIEIDTDMKPFLKDYNVIYDDILNVDIKELLKNENYENLYIVGNLPYYITSPIITHLIESKLNINKMVFMVQKEVADRYSSNPCSSDYGYMTIFINHYYDVKKEFEVSKYSFNPVPKVDSAVISLNKKEYIDIENEYFNFLKKCFQFKRKNLKNNLSFIEKDKLKEIYEKLNLNETIRPEEIEEETFIKIYNLYKEKK